jgi:hypothetical protein
MKKIKTVKGENIMMSKSKIIGGGGVQKEYCKPNTLPLELSCKQAQMKSILSILTAVVLLISSFTFSSCKNCGKKEPEPAGRGGKTSTDGNNKTKSSDNGNIPGDGNISDDNGKTPAGKEPEPAGRGGKTSTDGNSKTTSGDDNKTPDGPTTQDPVVPNTPDTKKELELQDIEPLVKAAAGHTASARRATHDANNAWAVGDMSIAKIKAQNASNEKKKVEDLTKNPIVAEAKNLKDKKNIVAHANAIGLLFERAKLDEVLALAAANNGSRDKINEQTEEARNAWKNTYTKAQTEKPDALKIAEEMFVEAFMKVAVDMYGGNGGAAAKSNFSDWDNFY